ncbi:hypothetical protein [Nocardia sp. JMUB6875]|uniref:hypothetical protein n=1 Tax=Nocardia sp. JMUB6875 TaxID=3158170 RepID=UPI0034E88547
MSPARVTVDSQAKLVTPYLVRITGTYRCPPGTPARLLVAFVPIPVAAGFAGPGADSGTIAGGEVGQIDADGRTHPFVIDLGHAADADEGAEQYRHGEASRVVAKLYYDELADRLDWERFIADGAEVRGLRWPRHQPVLATVDEIVTVG